VVKILVKDLFIIHPSVLHDAFRSDYETNFRQSSKDFLNMLLKASNSKGYKIGITPFNVYSKIMEKIKDKNILEIIPNSLMDIDYQSESSSSLDSSVIKLASRKSLKFKPIIVATKERIEQDGSTFQIITPKQAIDLFEDKNSRF